MLNDGNSDDGVTPKQKDLFQACSKGDSDKLKLYIDHKVQTDFTINGFSPLHIAAKKNHLGVIELF